MSANYRLISRDELAQPVWKDLVDRWYQLDEASRVLCQAVCEWQKQGVDFKAVEQIIYIFNQGSNQADLEFVQSQGLSPAKFVYTLPNIPVTIMQQMLKISVPTYCCETLSSHLVKSLTQVAKSVLIITLQAPSIASSTVAIDLWTVQALLTKGHKNTELESLRIG